MHNMSIFLDFFKQNSVFRIGELKEYLKTYQHKNSENSAYVALAYHCKNGTLTKIRNGLYAVNNPYSRQGINPLVIAGKTVEWAVISYHTALESHGIAYTNFNSHFFISPKKSLSFDFQGQHFQWVLSPLNKDEDFDYGVEDFLLEGTEIKRTNLARTVVDVLDRNDLSGGWEEIWRSLSSIVTFDAAFSVDYAIKLGRSSVVAKLGYFLEQRPAHLAISSELIEKLLLHKPKQLYYLDRSLPKEKSVTIHQWSLVVPRYLHEKEWEEPFIDTDF